MSHGPELKATLPSQNAERLLTHWAGQTAPEVKAVEITMTKEFPAMYEIPIPSPTPSLNFRHLKGSVSTALKDIAAMEGSRHLSGRLGWKQPQIC